MRGKTTCEEKHGAQRESERNSHVASYVISSITDQSKNPPPPPSIHPKKKEKITAPRKWVYDDINKGCERNPQNKQTWDSE